MASLFESQEPPYSWMISLISFVVHLKKATLFSLILVVQIQVIRGCKSRFYLYTSLSLSLHEPKKKGG